MQQRIIGVFDSGVGGLSVARAIDAALPQHCIIFRSDEAHVPYGSKTIEDIYGCAKPILEKLAKEGAEVIVVACNTVTTNLITELRQVIPVPLIGMEPPIKPAAEATKTGVIMVCATPRTLQSKRYAWLKETYAKEVKVVEPDCSNWAYLIETQQMDRDKVANIVKQAELANADHIVLGCTHYHWIESLMAQLCSHRAIVLQPERPVIAQLKRVLAQLA